MMETGLRVARQLDEDWLNQLLAQLAEYGKLANGGVDRQALSAAELDARPGLLMSPESSGVKSTAMRRRIYSSVVQDALLYRP